MASSFEDLKIWQKAFELAQKVYEATDKYPVEERYNLTSQTRSSANSVCGNIAESHGRFYYLDKIRVLYIARGEGEETRSHLIIAHARDYLDTEFFEYLNEEYMGLYKGISKYIDSISKQKEKSKKS